MIFYEDKGQVLRDSIDYSMDEWMNEWIDEWDKWMNE